MKAGNNTLPGRAGASYGLQESWLMVFKSVLLLISDDCSVASWAVQLHTNGLSSTWTVGPYWGTTKNANKNTAAISQSSGILTASLSLTTWGCGSKVQLKGKVHWLRTWSCAYVACGLELIHTWRTGIVQQCLHLLLVWRYLIMALGKCMLPINSIPFPGTAQGKKTELQTWTRFAGELRFFGDVAVLIASLDTDCIFFFNLCLSNWTGLAWTTKSRNHSWDYALFLLPHTNTGTFSSEGKGKTSPISW